MATKTMNDLVLMVMQDVYYAERQILKALPKMMKAASSEELRAAFEKHVQETEGQVERLKQVFKLLKQSPKGKTCPAILGLVEEGAEVMEDFEDSPALGTDRHGFDGHERLVCRATVKDGAVV